MYPQGTQEVFQWPLRVRPGQDLANNVRMIAVNRLHHPAQHGGLRAFRIDLYQIDGGDLLLADESIELHDGNGAVGEVRGALHESMREARTCGEFVGGMIELRDPVHGSDRAGNAADVADLVDLHVSMQPYPDGRQGFKSEDRSLGIGVRRQQRVVADERADIERRPALRASSKNRGAVSDS